VIVLDTSAVVAFLRDEAGKEVVIGSLRDGCMSAVSIAELVARMERDGMAPATTIMHLRKVALEIVAFDDSQAQIAGALIGPGREHGSDLAIAAASRLPSCANARS
jgi:PIN domain nuclease of toxin-antitoxin system